MTAGLVAAPTFIRTARGRAVVLGLAAVTMAVEMASLVVGRSVHIGSLPLSASVVPGLVLLGALGARSAGRPGDRDRLVPFWIAMGAGLLLGVALFSRTGDLADLLGLVVAAANEEIVYRFAVPVVLATALMVVKVPARPARVAGYVVAGAWWVLLPGHQAQTDGAVALVTYASFAVISAVVVARSRALVPISIAHCVLNVITIAHLRGDITSGGRGALSACLLFLLVGTFAWPGDRPGRRVATTDDGDQDLVTDTVIDVRDGQRPSVHRGDGVTWVEEPCDDDRAEPVGAPGDRDPSAR